MADPQTFDQSSLQADQAWSRLVHTLAVKIPRRLDQVSKQRRRMINLRSGR